MLTGVNELMEKLLCGSGHESTSVCVCSIFLVANEVLE